MFSHSNYFEETKNFDFRTMPEGIRKMHAYIIEITGNGDDWSEYIDSEAIKRTVDLYFQKLNEYTERNNSKRPQKTNVKDHNVSKLTKKKAWPEGENKPSFKKGTSQNSKIDHVEHIREEVKFIKRYASMNGKEKGQKQILSFINSLQRSIVEKKIRKESPYAEQIKYIQNNLIKVYNSMGSSVIVNIKGTVFEDFLTIIGSEKLMPSVGYIKRYIAMQGKVITKEKAEKLLTFLEKALHKKEIPGNDPYFEQVTRLKAYLNEYLKRKNIPDGLKIQNATLNGWQEALNGCGCGHSKSLTGLAGLQQGNVPSDAIMSSTDFSEIKFSTLGFKDKWYDLVGDPSANFSAMIYGKPKLGKSHLAAAFAGYLARNFGPVLYVAREESLNHTLQTKLNNKDVKHPQLFLTGALPDDLTPYMFIILDSVTALGLKPKDLQLLRDRYPDKSFIFIFQTTKEGNFRGENAFQHDVDIVIEVPEKGKAVQMGRFNQGGEMNIFDVPVAA